MFVAMKDGSHVHIDKINMDGSITSLVHVVEFGLMADEIVLYFDMDTRRLYFSDVKNDLINSVSENGSIIYMFIYNFNFENNIINNFV